MNTRLTETQLSEIYGSWFFFEHCPFEDESKKDLKDMTREEVLWLDTEAGHYETLSFNNKTDDDLDLEVQRNWRGFEISMKSLQNKCKYVLDNKLHK